MTHANRGVRTGGLVLVLATVTGCSDTILDQPGANHPPDTFITSGAPREHEATSYRVMLNWSGGDEDGHIAGFYYAWDDTVDDQGVPAWRFTTANDSTFVLRADSCPIPPCDGTSRPFFGYHTFWVKAVDDEGGQDPTPAFRTFSATTIAPEVVIEIGPFFVTEEICDLNSDHVYIQWRGSDPDGEIAGYWYKWDSSAGENPASCAPDPTACGWTFVPPESTSTASRRPQLFPGCIPRANSFGIFAVDDAGAIQQVARGGVNWTCFCPDSTRGGPGLCIDGGAALGTRSSERGGCDVETGETISPSDPEAHDFEVVGSVFEGTPVGFRWVSLRPEVGRTVPPIVGYRYAIDDPTAFSLVDATTTSIPDSIYDTGDHTLYVEAIYRGGLVDRGKFRWAVVRGPGHQDPPLPHRVLLVQDHGGKDPDYIEWRTESLHDAANWDTLLAGFRYDVWNTPDRGGLPAAHVVADYTTIIWNTGSWPRCTLREDLFKPRSEYLSSYVAGGGNVVLVGMNPMFNMVIRSPGVEGGDVCGEGPVKGDWMTWDSDLCGLDPTRAFPHFLFTRLGVRQMLVPMAPDVYEEVRDRTVRGCLPIASSGFDRYLEVDSLRAGGAGTYAHFRWIPAANVTLQSAIESWTTPMYHLDSPDPALIDNIIGIIAYGDRNPRRRAGTVAWGNSVFLGLNPYFLRQEDARWFFRKMLLEVCGEGYLP